jgi:hypothetical protein
VSFTLFCASASGYPTPPVSALLLDYLQYCIWDSRYLVPNLAGMRKASLPYGCDRQLTSIIKELVDLGLDIEDQGHPADYVGVNICKLQDGSYEFTQRAIIDSVIANVGLDGPNIATKPVPAKSTIHLHAHKSSPAFNGRFNYRSVVGKLNYLAQTTRPDIMYATHQIANYSSDPRKEHGEAIVYLVRYLKGTRHLGLKFKVNLTKGFECYVDADFSGAWNRAFAATDPSTAKSRGGWIVFYAGCPIIWASKLQTQVALYYQSRVHRNVYGTS